MIRFTLCLYALMTLLIAGKAAGDYDISYGVILILGAAANTMSIIWQVKEFIKLIKEGSGQNYK